MKRPVIFIAFICLASAAAAQQDRPFEKEIQAFEQQDRKESPLKGGILFTGSSSIRMWNDLEERFPGYNFIQRGFGGSQLSDVTHYARRIVLPYRPSKIFLYAGDNDIAAGQSADEIYAEFLEFHKLISDSLPAATVYYIAAKPSPSRQRLMPVYKEFNDKVASFIRKQSCNWEFVDVYSAMLDENGQPVAALFTEDMLHMNSKGYDIWEKLISPFL